MKTRLFLLTLSIAALSTACVRQKPAEVAATDSTTVTNSVTKKLITAKIYLKPEKVADFIDAAGAMIDSSNMEPGCESYMLYQNPYDKTKFIFVEIWKDQAAIDSHFSMTYFKAFGPKTQNWLSQPTELTILDVVQNK
jgi:quinol monooxygenase YgiN